MAKDDPDPGRALGCPRKPLPGGSLGTEGRVKVPGPAYPPASRRGGRSQRFDWQRYFQKILFY